jgi:hypothetical protein
MTVRQTFPRTRLLAAFSLLAAIVCLGAAARGFAQEPDGGVGQASNPFGRLGKPSYGATPRPKIIVRPPTFRNDDVGRLVAEPNVQFRSPPRDISYEQYAPPPASAGAGNPDMPSDGDIRNVNLDVAPPPGGAVPEMYPAIAPGYQPQAVENVLPGSSQPIFGDVISDEPGGVVVMEGECEGGDCNACNECSPFKQLFAFKLYKSSCDPGIGRERVRFALMEIERSEPLNSFSIRYGSFYNLHFPDRAEYFWAKQGRSPAAPEKTVDYQDIVLRLEQGGKRFSMYTEVPFRVLNPTVNPITAGPADISFGPKVVIVDGKRWQLSHIFSTFIQAGSVHRGLTAGHTSLEPGFMLRYKWTDSTYIHGDLKWRFPVGGDPGFQGDVLKWGIGVSTILYETDTFAALPTLEFVGWHVMSGMKTQPDGIIADVDQDSFFSIYPGMRFVLGPSGDLGLFELGVGGGFTLSNNGFFETMFRLDMRFSW